MSISAQLLQPIFVDINITYDLDMSKFPGLDDPQHMYQPALLIESPESRVTWMSVLSQRDAVVEDTRMTSADDYDDINDTSVTYSGESLSIEEDLYTLIDSCNLSPPCAVPESTPNDCVDALAFDGGLDLLGSLSTDACICHVTGCFHNECHQDNYYQGNLCQEEPWPLTEFTCGSDGEWFRELRSTKSCCVDATEWLRKQCSTKSCCGDAEEWLRKQCSTESSCGDAVELFREQCSSASSCRHAAEWFREQCSTEEQSCSMKAFRVHDGEVGNTRMPTDVCRTQTPRES